MIKILFLAANPLDTDPLSLGAESRAIDLAMRQSQFRDRFEISQHWAVRVADLQGLLMRYKPDIVHFSGHGSAASDIILEDDRGKRHPVSVSALSRLFSLLQDNVQCVVLNACYSEPQARAIAQHVSCVVGMSRAIDDDAAISFTAAFYQALGYGRDVKSAFELGRLQLEMDNSGEEHMPQLLAINADPSAIIFVGQPVRHNAVDRYEYGPINSPIGSLEIQEARVIIDYCTEVKQRFSTINMFGETSSFASPANDSGLARQMNSMGHGFLPLQMAVWLDGEDNRSIPLRVEDLFFQQNRDLRVVIRGLPGSGKTTLLRFLAYRFAALSLEEAKELIPVYMKLKDVNFENASLEEHIRQQIDQYLKNPAELDVLCEKKRFLESNMVLLFDGLDEIEHQNTSDAMTAELNRLAWNHPRCKIIVTSRPVSLQHQKFQKFKTLNLQPFDAKTVDEYIERWFIGRAEMAEQLRVTFTNRPRIRTLAENPFLLSMICFTFEQQGDTALIEHRSDLYENCTRFLLGRLYDPDYATELRVNLNDAVAILKDLSLRFFLWQEAHFSADHVNVIGKRVFTPSIVDQTEDFLDRVQRETGIIQRSNDGFSFIHRSLWEYFTALALLEKSMTFVISQSANPFWEEVIRLYAGLLKDEKMEARLIAGLWTINRPLALRATTETKTPSTKLIKPLVESEEDSQSKLTLMTALEHSLALIPQSDHERLVHETLSILLIDCEERNCEVIYHCEELLDRMGLKPLDSGGLIHRLLSLDSAEQRQANFLNDPDNYFQWIDVEGGRFWMGQLGHMDNETPHEVQVDSFSISKHPVTNRMYLAFPFRNPDIPLGKPNLPVTSRTWYEAYYFSLWVGASLPTEAEWEYAARGGTNATRTMYYFGDNGDELKKHAWFEEPNRQEAHPVDEKNPITNAENFNPLGIANMLGNVWEWCLDKYYDYRDYFSEGEVLINPLGPRQNKPRIFRGGTYRGSKDTARCARRVFSHPTNTGTTVGFRLVRRTSKLNTLK